MGDGGVFRWGFLQEHGDGVPRIGLCGEHPLAMRRRSKAWAGAVACSRGKNGIDQLPRANCHLHHLDVRPRLWDVRDVGSCAVVAGHCPHLGCADHRVEMVDGPLRFRPGRVGMAIAHLLAHPADEGKGVSSNSALQRNAAFHGPLILEAQLPVFVEPIQRHKASVQFLSDLGLV